MTYFADPSKGISHDAVNRLLRRDKLTGRILWEHVQGDIVYSPRGCLIFDDTVLNKEHSRRLNWFTFNNQYGLRQFEKIIADDFP